MESEILGNSPIRHIEFESEAPSIHDVPLPDQVPRKLDLRSLPSEILKTSTVESLLSQNEDLMARLKVALRRLSVLETENLSLAKSADDAHKKANFVQDQLLFVKEKDKSLHGKLRDYEVEREVLAEKIRVFEDRIRSQDSELARFRKYHEKVKTQIKPHLIQLKSYAEKLETTQVELENELTKKSALLQDIRSQMSEVTRNARQQVEMTESRFQDMADSYEKSIQEITAEAALIKQRNEELESKAMKLARSEQQRDEFQNEAIELRRSKEAMMIRFESESRRMNESLESLAKENARFRVENEDMRRKISDDFEKLKELQKQNLDLQSQLESLRFLWTSRNEENEKLKLSLSSLERLNVDLSSKIQEMRTGSPPAPRTK